MTNPNSTDKPQAQPALAASAGSASGVVLRFGNERGLTGPDYAIVELRNGTVIEVSDDGLNVYQSLQHFQNGELAKQGLVFETHAL